MAFPPVTARVIPTAFKIPDGFKTTIAINVEPGIEFYENTVKPPPIDGGEMIDISTMLNTRFHTGWPRTLVKLGLITGKAGYDPKVLNTIMLIVNLPTSVTIHEPDNATTSYWAYLQKWEPEEREEGKFPMANYTLACTNWDYANGVESGPLFVAAAGTN